MLQGTYSRVMAYLREQRRGVLSSAGPEGAWALPVHCRADGLLVECLLPRWADTLYHLELGSRLVLVLSAEVGESGWLQYQAGGELVPTPDWSAWFPPGSSVADPAHMFTVIRLRPTRIDLFDASYGWGDRETLEPG